MGVDIASGSVACQWCLRLHLHMQRAEASRHDSAGDGRGHGALEEIEQVIGMRE